MIMRQNSEFLHNPLTLDSLLGSRYIKALEVAYKFLTKTSKDELRAMVGKKIDFIPDFEPSDKQAFVESYRKPLHDDILTGYGIFKITEGKMLQIDWTGGHYQLPLGYHHPGLDHLLSKARGLGIVDDTHSNTPGRAVKLLSYQLVKSVNSFDDSPKDLERILASKDLLNRVTSVDTGTVAVSTGLKSILYWFRDLHKDMIPVFVLQEGNYHGTDFFEQRLRGMWEWLFANIVIEMVTPNDDDKLQGVFRKYSNSKREKIAVVMMEPVLMNNRAIYLKPEYLSLAKQLCVQNDAFLFLDEIQTGMWSPKVFIANEYEGVADMITVGKGLTAGYSPLAYMICKPILDNQNQYSSISTNGNADMAALAGLIVLNEVNNNREHIENVGNYYFQELQNLQRRHPDKITEITGYRHLAGISIINEFLAGKFHHTCLDQGIFARLQTYKEGASTIITKPAIVADSEDVDFVIWRMDDVLKRI